MMGLSVLHPGLLIAGLICISIPILVHLLRRKHRPISWGAMRFLEQAYRKRRRLITIEQLILLLARCAIVALIAGGVGALVLGSGATDHRPRTVVIVLDNPIHSASALDSGQPSIQYQKQRALDLLSSLDPARGDRAALITTAAPATGVATPATSELGLIRSRIEGVEATDADRDLTGSLGQVSDTLEGLEGEFITHTVLMLSHGGWDRDSQHDQQQLRGIESILLDAPPATVANNIAILDAQPLRPMVTRKNDFQSDNNGALQSDDEIQGVRITLQRSETSAAQSTPLVIANAQTDSQLVTIQLEWSAGQELLTQSIPLDSTSLNPIRGGSALLRVSVPNTDSNPRDNTRLVGLPIRQHIGVGIVDSFSRDTDSGIRPSRWVRAVLGANDGLMSIQQINASAASDRIDPTLDILFILSPSALNKQGWDRIARLNAAGMPIIMTPDATPGALDWAAHLNEFAPGLIAGTVQSRSFEHPISLANELASKSTLLDGIRDEYPDLASSVTLTRMLAIEPGPRSAVLIEDSDNQPLALVSTHNETNRSADRAAGTVVIWGVAFDARWTDLPARPLFVALTHELLRSLLAQTIAPDSRLAGQPASGLEFNSLEPLIGEAADYPDPRFAGAYVQTDQQGTAQRAVVVNPDASLSAVDESVLESPHAAIARHLPNAEIQELSNVTDLSSNSLEQSSGSGRSIALILFAIATILGIFELLLARRCSYKAVGSQPFKATLPLQSSRSKGAS